MQRFALASYTTVCEDGWYGEAHLCRQGWNVMYSEAMAEECLEEQQQRLNQHDKQV